MQVPSSSPLSTSTAAIGRSYKRKRWWEIWNDPPTINEVNALEIQPLQQQQQNNPSVIQQLQRPGATTTVKYRSLEVVPDSSLHDSLNFRYNNENESTTCKDDDNDDSNNNNNVNVDPRFGTNATSASTTKDTMSSYIYDYLYPPDIPVALQLLRMDNICIPISYFAVGMMQGLLRPLLNVYPIDLGATEGQQTMIASIATLPSALKIIYGFMSDNIPILGYRRKPYMLLGWILTCTSMMLLVYCTNLIIPNHTYSNEVTISTSTTNYYETTNDSNNYSLQQQIVDSTKQRQKDLPSMSWLMISFFLSGSGMWISDVMADSLVAQKVPYEPIHVQGQMQSTCYACRFFGIAFFAPVSTYLYSHGIYGYSGPLSIVLLLAITPIITAFPFWFVLQEDRHVTIPSTTDQCKEIWKTVCSRSVWQPIGFVYLYNILQIPNAAWRQYLKTVLLFTSDQLNVLLTVSYILLYIGTVVYKTFFLKASWRYIYYTGFLLNAIASIGQLALVRGYTFGIPPFYLALGDDAIMEFIVGIQMLPICILMVSLCPHNSEGASYAMFTTAWNSAMLLAQAIGSSFLLSIWDTSKEALIAGNVNGVFNLSLLTTFIQMIPIFFVWWLPHGRTELEALGQNHGDKNSSSAIGGGIFLFVVFSSVLYTIVVTLLNVLVPGWIG